MEGLKIPAPGFDESRQLAELRHADRGLHVGGLQVIADVRIDVLVIVAVRQAAKLPIESLAAGILAARFAPAIAPPIAERLHQGFEPWLVGQHTPTFTQCDVVTGVEADSREIAKGAHLTRTVSTCQARKVGTFGDLATVSFYPAHHITLGEGGCVLTDKPGFKTLVESFRDWGRDCWCEAAAKIPAGSDSSGNSVACPTATITNIYSHIGYNLKATDMQAAVGVAQLRKLPGFI